MKSCQIRIMAIAMSALLVSLPAIGETVKRGLVACISEDLLDEAVTYATKRDNGGLMQLLTTGRCTILKEGEQVSVISPGFMTATIRYRGVKLYTPSEAVR
jgi:hypothetical protein